MPDLYSPGLTPWVKATLSVPLDYKSTPNNQRIANPLEQNIVSPLQGFCLLCVCDPGLTPWAIKKAFSLNYVLLFFKPLVKLSPPLTAPQNGL